MHKKVAVIGGGLGGLSAAIRLAHHGFQVRLHEQNERLGGKMNEYVDSAYRFDTGPSLLTMPFIVDDLFSTVGVDLTSFIKFIPVEPICRYFWLNGSTLNASHDISKMTTEIKKFSKIDAQHYEKFLNYTKRIYDLTANIFLFNPIHEINKMINFSNLRTLFKFYQIDPLRTMHQGISRYFENPFIVQLFDRYATYNGSNPFQAPATLNIISYVEYGLGCFYIQGGIYRLVEALANLAKTLDVEIHNYSRVEKIIYKRNQVQGIVVNDNFISSDYVICNSDVVVTYNQLIDGFPGRRNRLNKLQPSLSGMVFLWGVEKKHPQLIHHNIIFSTDYRLEFKQIFEYHCVPDDPTIYIAISSKTDPDHASLYGENWFVLVNTPYLLEDQNWICETERMREIILNKLKKLGIDISNHIETENVVTPEDFYRLYCSNRGSIYGISSNRKTTAFRRPPNRSRDIKGLYFVGGSVHPGGGIPLVLLSGKICADLILKDCIA